MKYLLVALAFPALYLGAKFGFPELLPVVAVPSPGTSTPFEPLDFFEGETSSVGTLSTVLGKERALSVRSLGQRRPDGALVITQTISLEGEPERTRTWVLEADGENSFSGSLSDATGDVTAIKGGRRMVIGYDTEDGTIRQTLTQIGEGEVLNRLDVYKWGLNIARLDATITRG